MAKERREMEMAKISFFLPVVFAVAFSVTNSYSVQADEHLINTLFGFDPSNAVFSFDSGAGSFTESVTAVHFDQLRKRVEQKFQKAGMKFGGIAQQGTPCVCLIFQVTPVEGIEGKSMYFRKLEIQEDVLIERLPGRRFYTTTYEIGFGSPILVDTPTIEQIEKDLDSLVDGFIEDHRVWNSKRNRS